jgi:hypothetical protein
MRPAHRVAAVSQPAVEHLVLELPAIRDASTAPSGR